jgi:hypothetical protein
MGIFFVVAIQPAIVAYYRHLLSSPAIVTTCHHPVLQTITLLSNGIQQELYLSQPQGEHCRISREQH